MNYHSMVSYKVSNFYVDCKTKMAARQCIGIGLEGKLNTVYNLSKKLHVHFFVQTLFNPNFID